MFWPSPKSWFLPLTPWGQLEDRPGRCTRSQGPLEISGAPHLPQKAWSENDALEHLCIILTYTILVYIYICVIIYNYIILYINIYTLYFAKRHWLASLQRRKFWCFKSFPGNADLCNSSSKAVEDRGLPQLVHQFWREQYPMLRDLDWRSPSCQWDLYQNDPIWTLAAWQRCRPRRRWGCLRMKIWHGTSRCNEGDRHIWQELNYIWDGFFQHVPLEHLQKTMLTEKPTLLQAAVGWLWFPPRSSNLQTAITLDDLIGDCSSMCIQSYPKKVIIENELITDKLAIHIQSIPSISNQIQSSITAVSRLRRYSAWWKGPRFCHFLIAGVSLVSSTASMYNHII